MFTHHFIAFSALIQKKQACIPSHDPYLPHRMNKFRLNAYF